MAEATKPAKGSLDELFALQQEMDAANRKLAETEKASKGYANRVIKERAIAQDLEAKFTAAKASFGKK